MNLALRMVDIAALSPLLILLNGALAVLLVECFGNAPVPVSVPPSLTGSTLAKKPGWLSFWLILTAISGALCASIFAPFSDHPLLTPWLRFDTLSQLFTMLFLLIGLSIALLTYAFFQRFYAAHGEYYFLLLTALLGLLLIGASADFLTLFLGIETLSISLYVLCGYMKKWEFSQEAAAKYFLMGSLAAAFLLYGIALIYGAIGTTRLDALLSGYRGLANISDQTLFLTGAAFVTLGLAFEAAIVPFHVWAPDVYAGASTPVTAFMAVGTKVGAFAAFIRVFLEALPQFNPIWNEAIALLAYLTLIYANFVALQQTQLRRFFAYSGISHAGFLLIPLAAGLDAALPALLFYLTIYVIATLGAFAVLAFVDKQSEGVMLKDLQGLFKKAPWLASLLTLSLLTLAGIPPTAGFLAKFYLFKVAFDAGFYGLVIVGLLTAILSAFYYLRIISLMLTGTPSEEVSLPSLSTAAAVAIASFAALIILSVYQIPLFALLAAGR